MKIAPFTVMDASAGSGKTRNLVKAVLVESLKQKQTEFALRPIMAITFTNKAAAEMKGRLLDYLIDFASNNPKEAVLLSEISEEIECPVDELKTRAKQLLKYILHHYNDLSFGTIDAFTSRLVRTFAKDLSLAENFEIVLDTDQMLSEATSLVINDAGKDPELTQMLLDFVAQKLEDEKAWSIEAALKDMAKKLLEEKHREPLSRLRDFTPSNLLSIRKKLEKKRRELLAIIEEKGKEGLALLAQNNLKASAFYRGSTGIFNYFNFLAEKRLDKIRSFNSYVQTTIDEDKWYGTKATAAEKSAIDGIKNQLLKLALTGKELAQKHVPTIVLIEQVNKNMFALATLNALDAALAVIEESQNILPLAAFNHIVNTKVKNEPAPFIFERLGEKYKHFFIDEFQDTSKLQWQNLLPLIENGVASTGTSLVVGDAKQSIYRWRNGEAEQFIDLSFKASTGKIQPAIAGKLHPLVDNWRSRKNVVDFNNALFTHAANEMNNEGYKSLYSAASQIPKKGKGGYVEIKTFDKNTFNEDALAYTLHQIESLRDEGYNYRDIVLLVRGNKDGAALVQELTTRNLPVISADSLLLGNSYEANLLAGLIAFRSAPNNKKYRWHMAKSLVKMGYFNQNIDVYEVSYKLVNQGASQVLKELEKNIPGLSEVVFAATDLYTFAAQLCLVLQLNGKHNAFTQAFLQAIHNYVESENGNTFGFVSWWEEKGQKTAISAPDQIDAIKVATIHKSKGLQFPVVIIPYVRWRYKENTREAWINLPKENFEGLSEMLVNISKNNAEFIGGEYANAYEELVEQEKFDSLNMLYVACTRAEERLYFCGKIKATDTDIFSVVQKFLETQEKHEIGENEYAWGEKLPPVKGEETIEPNHEEMVNTSGWQSKVKMAITAPKGWQNKIRDARTWGNKVHFILAKIKTSNDVKPVLHALKHQGSLQQDELHDLERMIHSIINHPSLKVGFMPGVKVFNERDVLLPNQTRVRPDRIVQLPNGNVVLVDYKTGEPNKKHQEQLQQYEKALTDCGFRVAEKHLVYSNEELKVLSV